MPDDFFSLRFTTSGLTEADGVASHRENLAKALGVVQLEPIGEIPFEADARLTAAPGFGLATMGTSPSRVFRRPELATESEESLFVVLLGQGSGDLNIMQGSHDLDLAAGQAVVLRDTEPHISTSRRTRGHTLRLPNASLARLLTDFDSAIGRVVPFETPGLSLFAAYLDGVHDALQASPALRKIARAHIGDLLAVILGATRDAEAEAMGRGVPAARLRAIKLDMSERLHHPDLTAETVARRQGVSARYVQKLFEKDNTTFGQYLNGLRLAQVHCRLSNPDTAHLSIAEIVFESGFNELSTFYRLFRQRYGATPSDIRAAAREAEAS